MSGRESPLCHVCGERWQRKVGDCAIPGCPYAPESVRDRLERRAHEIRAETQALAYQRGGQEEVAIALGAARALEEVVAALDGASARLTANPGASNGRRSAQEPADGDFEGGDVSPGGSA